SALLDELIHHAFDEIRRNAEGDAAVAAIVGSDGGVDADDFAVHVNEWSTAGTGVDGSVRLQEFLDADGITERHLAAIASADDAEVTRFHVALDDYPGAGFLDRFALAVAATVQFGRLDRLDGNDAGKHLVGHRLEAIA